MDRYTLDMLRAGGHLQESNPAPADVPLPKVAFSPDDKAEAVSQDTAPSNLAEIDAEIARTEHPAGRAVLQEERARLSQPKPPPPTWDAVVKLPEMQALPFDQREAARHQYFLDVVAPQIPTEHLDSARAAFDADTKPSKLNEAIARLSTVVRIPKQQPEQVPSPQLEDAGALERPARMTLTPAGQPRYLEAEQPSAQTGLDEPPAQTGLDEPLVLGQKFSENRFVKDWAVPFVTGRHGVLPRQTEEANLRNREMVAAEKAGGTSGELAQRAREKGWRDLYAGDFWRNVATSIQNVPADYKQVMGGFLQVLGEYMDAEPETPRLRAFGKSMANMGADFYDQGDQEMKKTSQGMKPGVGAEIVGSTILSVTRMVPALAAGMLTKSPAVVIAIMSGETGASSYAQARKGDPDNGVPPLDRGDAATYALIQAVVEGGTEYLPVKALLAKGPMTAARRFYNVVAREVPGEELATFLQDAADKAYVKPNMTLEELMHDLAITGPSTILAAGAQTAAVHAAGAAREPAKAAAPAPAARPAGDLPTVGELLGEPPKPAEAVPAPQAEPSKSADRIGVINGLLDTVATSLSKAREAGDEGQVTHYQARAKELLDERAALERESNPDVDTDALQRQNRDRTRAASVAQVQSIANAPDYDRLATAPIPDVGAPMVSVKGDEALPAADMGKTAVVTLGDGTKVPVRYAVVEAGSVLASNDVNGKQNPEYFENVIPKGKIVAMTNGRVAGLQGAYARDTAKPYVDGMLADPAHGVSVEAIKAKKNPMLVRVFDDAYNSLPRLAELSNTGGSAPLSVAEKARNDAARITSLDGFAPSESGDVTAASNLPFVRQFMQALSKNDRPELMTADGQLSQEGARRLRAAVFAKAYGGGEALMRMVESTDDNVRSITAGLMRAAPAVARLREKVAAGALQDLDITQDVLRAIEELSRLRESGVAVGTWLAQADMFGKLSPEFVELLSFLEENSRSGRRIADFLERYLAAAEAIGAPGGMFETETPGKAAIVRGIRKEMADERQAGLPQGAQPDATAAGTGARGAAETGAEPGAGAVQPVQAGEKRESGAGTQVGTGLIVPPEPTPTSPLAGRPISDRWETDVGSMPGEPMFFMDTVDGDLDTAKAFVTEQEVSGGSIWELHDKDAKLLGRFSTSEEAMRAAERHFPVTKQKFSLTQAPLPAELSASLKQIAKRLIAPDDVEKEHGLEDRPHITVKFGLHTSDVAAVQKVVSGEGPIQAKVTGIEIFSPDGKDYDVVVQRVSSPDLTRMNKAIADAIPNTDTHPVYRPHITLGYVKRGRGKKYADAKTGLEGQTITLDTIEVSDQNENLTPIKLTGEPKAERRADVGRRKAIAEMSPDEMRRELLTDPLTGLANRRAYDESKKQAVQVSIDLDSLKWINDNLGHSAGDEILRALGTAIRDQTGNGYHLSGDEFAIQANSEQEARRVVQALRNRLMQATLVFKLPDGSEVFKKGVNFSHGIGPTLEEADTALRSSKAEREVSGERARRGEPPAGVTRQPAQGREAPAGEAATKVAEGAGGIAPLVLKDGKEQYSVDEPLPPKEGTPADRKKAAAIRDLFSEEALPGAPSPGEFDTLVAPVQRGEIRVNSEKIDSPESAAHAFAALRKEPREKFQVLVLDKNDKPIAALHLFAGTIAQTSVYPREVLTAVYQTPGAAKIWMAHNHPSGVAASSAADERLTQDLTTGLGKSIGVEFLGHIIIAGKRAAAFDNNGPMKPAFNIPAGTRNVTVPIMERTIRKQKFEPRDAMSSPANVRSFLRAFGKTEPGLVLLNAHHNVTGWLPMSLEEAQKLRTGDANTGAGRLFRTVGVANPAAAIFYSPQEQDLDRFARAVNNLSGALNLLEVKMLDAMAPQSGTGSNALVSLAERGTVGAGVGNTFLSRMGELRHSLAGMTQVDVNAVADIYRKGFKGLPPVHVLESVKQAPAALRADIKQLGGENDTAGAWHNGEVYLFSDNINSPMHAEWVILHESTHHGLRGMLGSNLKPLLMDIYLRNESVRKLANDQRTSNPNLSVIDATEEVLANMGADSVPQGLMARIVAAVHKFLRKIGFKLQLSDADIQGLVAQALRFVKEKPEQTHVLSGTALNWKIADHPTKPAIKIGDEVFSGLNHADASERAARKLDVPVQKIFDEAEHGYKTVEGRFVTRAEADAMWQAPESGLSRTAGQPPAPRSHGSLLEHPAVKSGYRAWAQKTVDTLDGWLDPISTLPKREEYLVERYKTLGVISRADELAAGIRAAFADTSDEDKQAVYDYLVTAGALPNEIKNATTRVNAEQVKREIGKVGDALVERGMLSEESREQYRDGYLPRLYLKHLLSEADFKALGAGKKPSNMGYLKERKDIPEEVRKVILGEITDPGFLAAVAVAKPLRDMVLLDWLNAISQRTEWVLPGVLVQWGDVNLMKPAAFPQQFGAEIPKRLVSAYWLKDEAARLRKQAEYQDEKTGKKAIDIATQMERAANKALEGLPQERDDYKQMPDTARYGRMRGIWVRKEIYDDLMGVNDFIPTDPGFFQKLLGYGGIGTRLTQIWKTSKVALNPPGQIRNFVSNGVLLNLSGVSLPMVPVRVTQALGEIINDGKHWKIAKKYGIKKSTFAAEELYRAKRDLLAIERETKGMAPLAALRYVGEKVMELGGDVYQFSESLFKVAKIIDEMAKGATEQKAMLEAQKWLFDYSLVSREVRYLRNAPIGVPFLTFPIKVLPRMVEVAMLHPWRFAPYAALMYGMAYALAAAFDVDDDDLERLKKALPEWLRDRGHAMLWPYKDEKGRWQVLDLGYFFPWTQFAEIAHNVKELEPGKAIKSAGLLSGPLTDMIVAIKSGKDSFTGRDIYKPGDPPARQAIAIMNYLWQMAAPPFLTDMGFVGHAIRAYTGETNKYGDPVSTPTQAALRLFGVNMYSMEPEQTRAANIRKQQFEIQEVKQAAKQRLMDRSLSDEKRSALVEEFREEAVRRQEKLVKYISESGIHPNLQTAR